MNVERRELARTGLHYDQDFALPASPSPYFQTGERTTREEGILSLPWSFLGRETLP